MNKKSISAVSGVILAMLLAAWLLGWFGGGNYSDDPKVAELEKVRDESIAKQPNRDERRTQRAWFEEQMKGLTEEQRWAFIESSAAIFIPLGAARFESQYDKFMKLPAAERQRELDKRIDEMEARGGPDGRGGPGGGGRPPIDPKRADEFRKKMNAWTTPDQRAKFENGIRMFNDRRKERGLDPVKPPGGGGFF